MAKILHYSNESGTVEYIVAVEGDEDLEEYLEDLIGRFILVEVLDIGENSLPVGCILKRTP